MIKALQKKFVVTAMTAVSVLLLILLGAINLINIETARGETDKTFVMISEAGGDFERFIQTVNSVSRIDRGKFSLAAIVKCAFLE